MDAAELEIYRALRDAQNKYAYFLLAAAGAAIRQAELARGKARQFRAAIGFHKCGRRDCN